MKIFLSWSGNISKEIGQEFKNWLPSVLQAVDPYFTPDDIDKGTRWASEISENLQQCEFGIFFLTKDNLNSSWMHFEAGAISKGYETSRIYSILFGIDSSEVRGPFNQYQATNFSKEEIFKLVQSINEALNNRKLITKVLETVFEKFWPDLKLAVMQILNRKNVSNKNIREDRDILEEILSISRFTLKTQESIIHENITSTKDKDYIAGREYEKLKSIKQQRSKLEEFELISEHNRQADFLLEKDAKKAIIIYDKALEINGFHEPALIGKAKAYRRLDSIDRAIEILNDITLRNVEAERAFYNMACYKILSDKYSLEDSMNDLTQAIKLHANYRDYALRDKDFLTVKDEPMFIELTKWPEAEDS